MNSCKKTSIKKINNHNETVNVSEEFVKKEELVLKDNTNVEKNDGFTKVKSALRKSLALNIVPETLDDKKNELRSKVLGYMKDYSNKNEIKSQFSDGNYVRHMSKKFENDSLKNYQKSYQKVKKYETQSETTIEKPLLISRQYNSDIEISDKIPDVGGLRNYYRYMGYTDINNTVEVVSELKASFNDKSKPFTS
uniref:Lipoprotein n=1 Tax=Strongyloides stercoralis TaxID=6248 RepID=A0A0K0DZ41_STRER